MRVGDAVRLRAIRPAPTRADSEEMEDLEEMEDMEDMEDLVDPAQSGSGPATAADSRGERQVEAGGGCGVQGE